MKNTLAIVISLVIIYMAMSALRTSPFNDVLMAKRAIRNSEALNTYAHTPQPSGSGTYSEKTVIIHSDGRSKTVTIEGYE